MLIVTSRGDRAVVLDNASCIEIDPRAGIDLVVVYRRNFKKAHPLSPNFRDTELDVYWLGTFPSTVAAQRAFDDLIDAYERGAKVYRIPPFKFYAADTSQNEKARL